MVDNLITQVNFPQVTLLKIEPEAILLGASGMLLAGPTPCSQPVKTLLLYMNMGRYLFQIDYWLVTSTWEMNV